MAHINPIIILMALLLSACNAAVSPGEQTPSLPTMLSPTTSPNTITRLPSSTSLPTKTLEITATRTPPSNPTAKPEPLAFRGGSLTYDRDRGLALYFGGARAGYCDLCGETWAWDGSQWFKINSPVSPSPRLQPGLVYDAAREKVLLFGGWDGQQALNDTWLWDGETWVEAHPLVSPSPRQDARLVYDVARQVILLFGGSRDEGDDVRFLSETWTWDGQTWTEHPSGELSNGAIPQPSLVYDSARQQVVMWQYGTGAWTWDGRAWTHQQAANSPDLFVEGVLGYDEDRGQVILWHPAQADSERPGIWVWDGVTWSPVNTGDLPRPIYSAESYLSYDNQYQALLLFTVVSQKAAGEGFELSIWRWTGAGWQLVQGSMDGSVEVTAPAPDSDTEIVFTIVNEEQFSGREGDPKPDWLAWGAQAFTIAPDGSFWIADSADIRQNAEPPRLLHFNPRGEMLQEVHLEGQLVGLADVTADGDHVWALSIASLPPKVLRFTSEGIYIEGYDLPEGLRPENGLTGIALAEDGVLLVELEGGARLFRLVNEDGELDPQPVPSPFPKRWVTRRGSYYVETFEMDPDPAVQGKRVVRYYSAEGMLIGELELPEPAVYAQHDLVLGPDGRLYFMVSRADRSVEIWRLGFGGNPFPEEKMTPAPSLTPLSPQLPAWETPPPGASDLTIARWTLLSFFTFLRDGRYGEAAALYGGSYEDHPVVRDDLPPTSEDKALVWESECALLQCLLISRVVEETQVSPDEYLFVIEFMNEDGSLFVLGPCCGATEAEMPKVWQWLYSVKRVGGQFKVMGVPVYVP